MGKGAWRDLDAFITKLHNTNISNEQFDMIYKEAQSMITEFANIRMKEKYREAFDRNGYNVPNIYGKIQLINQMVGTEEIQTPQTNITNEREMDFSEGYGINEFGKIIKSDINGEQSKNFIENRFGTTINSSRYNNKFNSNRNQNKLTLGQKAARFIQRNNIFMNLSFVKNFVHKQLDLLPETEQVARIETTTNRARENFINQLTNIGECSNLPQIQRKSVSVKDEIFLKINNSQYDKLVDLIAKQTEEKKEQFATMLCSTKRDEFGYSYLEADSLDEWAKDNLQQTETTVEPQSWKWVIDNIETKNMATDYHISTVVSVHTHPAWYGTGHELDHYDRETFINWTRAFRRGGIDMIHGIMSNDGIKFYRYDENTQSFENVILQVENRFIPSTLPKNVKEQYCRGNQEDDDYGDR